MTPATGSIALDLLPETVSRYLSAHRVRDIDTALDCFTVDAQVTDEGHTWSGRDGIRAWMERTSTEYNYTIEPISASHAGPHHTVVQHLEGDFPGGVVNLRFEFDLDGDLVSRLVIAV